MKTTARYALAVIATLLASCTAATVLRYSCEGKCSGELSRDIETKSPEQLTKKPK